MLLKAIGGSTMMVLDSLLKGWTGTLPHQLAEKAIQSDGCCGYEAQVLYWERNRFLVALLIMLLNFMRPAIIGISVFRRRAAMCLYPLEVTQVVLTAAVPDIETEVIFGARFYSIIGLFCGMHSTSVYLDLSVTNAAFLIINFFLLPRSRPIEIDAGRAVQSLGQNIQVTGFLIVAYTMIKKIYNMYVRSEIEREDNDKILNSLKEGILIMEQDTQGKPKDIILMNPEFRAFNKFKKDETVTVKSLEQVNLVLNEADFLNNSMSVVAS